MRNRKNLIAALAFAFSLFPAIFGFGVSAASSGSFSVVPESTAVRAGEDAVLELRLNRETEVAGFRIFVFFDSAVFTYEAAEPCAAVAEDTLRVSADETHVAAVYVCGAGSGGAPVLSGTVLRFRFRAGEGAPVGAAEFSVKLDETCDYDGNNLGMDLSRTLTVNIAGDASAPASSHTRSAEAPVGSGSESRTVSSGNTASKEKTITSENTVPDEKTVSSGNTAPKEETASCGLSSLPQETSSPAVSAVQSAPDSQAAVVFSSDREKQLNVLLGTLLAVAAAAVLALLIVRRK